MKLNIKWRRRTWIRIKKLDLRYYVYKKDISGKMCDECGVTVWRYFEIFIYFLTNEKG